MLQKIFIYLFDVSDEFQHARMNGETPSVPITTLAGIASLTDCKWIFIHTTFLKRFDLKKSCEIAAVQISYAINS